jgi:hypothetical protein
VEEISNACKILVNCSDGRRLLARSRYMCKDTTATLKESLFPGFVAGVLQNTG